MELNNAKNMPDSDRSTDLETSHCPLGTPTHAGPEEIKNTTEQEQDAVLLKKWKIFKRIIVVITRFNNLEENRSKITPQNVKMRNVSPKNASSKKMMKLTKDNQNKRPKDGKILVSVKKNARKEFCEQCEYNVTTTKKYLAVHNRKYHSGLEKKFHCKFCRKSFGAQFMLNHHLASNNCPEPFKKCSKCSKYFREEDFLTHDNACPLICTVKSCKKTFYCPAYFKLHTRFHKKNYPCSQCNKRFTRCTYLKEHIEGFHLKLMRFFCDFCNKGFSSKGKLSVHISLHQPKGPKNFHCDICGNSFSQKVNLRNHIIAIHFANSGIKKFSCSICKKDFMAKHQYNGHLRTHIKHQFSCNQCNASYAHLDKLEKHKREFHSTKNNYFCKICGHGSRTKILFKLHRSVHEGSYKFTCDICSKKFKERAYLKVHIRTHFPNRYKRFSCHLCSYRSDASNNLKSHMICHGGANSLTCDICNKKFNRMKTLRYHVSTHFPDRLKPFACHLCSYRSDLIGLVRWHMTIHGGKYTRSFACDICNKKFNYKQSLKRHIRTRHNPDRYKPIACHLCSYRADNNSKLKQHMNTHRA